MFFFFQMSFHLCGFITPFGRLPSFMVPVFLPYPFGLNGDDRHLRSWEKKTVFVQGSVPSDPFVEIDVDAESKLLPANEHAQYIGGPWDGFEHFESKSRMRRAVILPGESRVHGFGMSNGRILFGGRAQLAARLTDMHQEFVAYPFLYTEVCQFTGLNGLLPEAVDRAAALLAEHNSKLASHWKGLMRNET